jgi:predicted RNA-binding Zn-ribbon protein involved in translation (DUF1610 family)
VNDEEMERRERLHSLIRGGILAMQVENATKKELLAEMDALSPACPECNVEQIAETFKCPECGPTP